MNIQKVAVIGAGVMGAGIAAHIANAGTPVLLLDIVPEGATDRSQIAKSAIGKMLKADPAPFMHNKNARLVTPGNIEDDLEALRDCDWIIEAVIERLAIKQDLYRKLAQVRKADAIVSSNTSSIPLHELVSGLPEDFAAHFMITHFFNPPRYMRLLEVVTTEQTDPDAADKIRTYADLKLGKGVVPCKDTPGFIANRIGIFWIQTAIQEAIALGLTVEEADAVVGKPMGIPKTGVFGLSDLVGIDLMPHLMRSMNRSLPPDDLLLKKASVPLLIQNMIETGYTGRKGKGGFYRLNRDGGQKIKESINLQTGEYSPSQPAKLESVKAAKEGGLQALVSHPDKGGQYAWKVLSQTLHYAAALVPEIADDICAVNTAMKLGYNWKYGPFELIDQLGAEAFAQHLQADSIPPIPDPSSAGGEGSDELRGDGVLSPPPLARGGLGRGGIPPLLEKARKHGFYQHEADETLYLQPDGNYIPLQRPPGVLLLADIKRHAEPLLENDAASLWDIGDGVACLEFHSKLNSLDPQILEMIEETVEFVPRNHKALVIYNEGSNFSAGANLGLLVFAAKLGGWDEVDGIVRAGQQTYKKLKYAPFPVIGAPFGLALGGGCEILLHCDALQAHAETYVGLVETGVGLIPGWGGCKEMLHRWSSNPRFPRGPLPAVLKCFEIISVATVAKSAFEARDYLFLRPTDGISMNRDRLLADAKTRALAMVDGYQPPEPPIFHLPGPTAKVAMAMAVSDFRTQGKATDYDVVIADTLATVLSGGDTDMTDTLSEDDLLDLEFAQFAQLVRKPETLARVQHMLETGKPLRN
ncbi:3-hydroxyacyl-CoA dehydrogenase/enoyl-CoA hydratase family protein [Candidatus Thiothrix sp. Deng01]|uniref:3-hydroxyacyl-CoA dehydrogenase/enoyl-CoA hydratase family protein n=1 Tax=Candidatus Thiothrix phosphatis TaxID=3112415 RepID=A0ABU6CX69_9GAMM|nr:3-hydroxyacyl-CoA dehydrogenase/enoyl-CoA hydratase family protein [Candidatus Thiothrix sp. Deng01]MEB4591420.1 3-hydroxyacyl-CoA dehydrogenase/enoyl-CoA hydratase family protein [Candidatus Thiothrix sp. Deng01]